MSLSHRRTGLVSTVALQFQAVAELGSIRKAAQSLRVAPSAVSRAILKLERELNCPLFERYPSGLKLTSAGEILATQLKASFSEIEGAYDAISEISTLHKGRVSLAVFEDFALGPLPSLLNDFWCEHPRVSVDTFIGNSAIVLDRVTSGEADLAIAFEVETNRRVKCLASVDVKIGAILHPSHPLASRASVSMDEFTSDAIVRADTLTFGNAFKDASPNFFEDLAPRATANLIFLMTKLGLLGGIVSFQTRISVERELSDGKLVFVPIDDRSVRPCRLILAVGSKMRLPVTAERLAETIASKFERIAALENA
jgi:DNA-binding transcriptional LysR family regulator